MADPDTLMRWRRELQQLYDSLMNSREQFCGWFEEAALVKAEIESQNEELRECIADIKRDQQRYSQMIAQLPNVEKFSAQELENRTGKASQLLALAREIVLMETHLPRKIDKLRFLQKHALQ